MDLLSGSVLFDLLGLRGKLVELGFELLEERTSSGFPGEGLFSFEFGSVGFDGDEALSVPKLVGEERGDGVSNCTGSSKDQVSDATRNETKTKTEGTYVEQRER